MKNLHIQILIGICSVFLLSCNNESLDENKKYEQTKVNIESKYNLLNIRPNVYHDYFKKSDNTIKFTSLKSNVFKPHNVVRHSYFNDETIERDIFVNDKVTEAKSKSESVNIKSMSIYGKTVRFRVSMGNSDNTEMRSKNDTNVEIYIPELVKITNPSLDSPNQRYPFCDASNFLLEWNADSNNTEGLVVIAEYSGKGAIPESNINTHILNTDYIENDNGSFTLNPNLFQDIPNLAYVDIILLRGNIAIEEIEGELYKFVAESHQRMPITLVKDISKINVIN